MNKNGPTERVRAPQWVTPRLEFKGGVGDILHSGGGKFSITGADSGEMRCEKPHSSQCS